MSAPQIYLITPLIDDPAGFADQLAAACAGAAPAAVLLRLAPAEERGLIRTVKALAPIAQEHDAAMVLSAQDGGDLTVVMARGGADGIHALDPDALPELRSQLKGDRILGAGGLDTRHDAMQAGEIGVDYVLFGAPGPDGATPPLDEIVEQTAWWAEIFEIPCVGYAPSLGAVEEVAATGAEFVALGDAVWTHADGPGAAMRIAHEILSKLELPA